jgi:hypothetical protein
MIRSLRGVAALGAVTFAMIAGAAGCSKKEPEPAAKPAPTSTSTTSKPVPAPEPVAGVPVQAIPGHSTLQDFTSKEGPRLIPAEVYLQSYIRFFGDDLTPLEVESLVRGDDAGALFDRWANYLSSMGFADYKLDVSHPTDTNTLMMATFERLGIALCVRRAEIELQSSPPPLSQRRVFAFDMTPGEPTEAEFDARFDVLHRTFLAYPASLAPTDRASRFLQIYRDVVARHTAGGPSSRFTPQQAGWAAVCYGLVRHPEFVIY